jgi:hypothetical protein
MRTFVVAMLLMGCGGTASVTPDARVADAAGSGDADAVGGGDGANAVADTAIDAQADRAGDAGAAAYPPCEQFTVDVIACGANDAGSIPQLDGHYCGLCEGQDPTGHLTAPPVSCIALQSSGLPVLCVATCSECS